jgi:hypothetical protein
MDGFQIYLIVIGVLQIISIFFINTSGIFYTVLYKVVPFFSGCYCIFYALYDSGIIKINV